MQIEEVSTTDVVTTHSSKMDTTDERQIWEECWREKGEDRAERADERIRSLEASNVAMRVERNSAIA